MHSAHDPIGAASARLLGAGIARHDRLFALRVLGLLLDHADRDGIVHLLPATLAGEFELDRAAVETAFLQLRNAGVLVPAPAGWHIDGYEGYDGGGVNAGAALALIADLLEGPDVEPAPPRRPAPSLVARAYPVLTGVLVVLLVLVAANGPTGGAGRDVALRVAGIERSDLTDDARRPEAPREPARTPSSSAPTSRGTEPDAPATAVPSTSRADRSTTSSTAEAPPPTSALGQPTGGACPQGAPLLEVVEVTALPVPANGGINGSLAVPVDEAGWYVIIEGTLENPADAPLTVERFEVIVTTDEGEHAIEGLTEPVLLEPGETHDWSVSTASPLTAPPPGDGDVEAVLRVWRWAETCG